MTEDGGYGYDALANWLDRYMPSQNLSLLDK